MSSVLSRRISDKPASGKPMLLDLERSESVSDKLASGKPMLVTQQTITDSEYMQKSVPKCEKTSQKVQSWALKRGIRVIQSKWVQNILEGSQTRLHAGNGWSWHKQVKQILSFKMWSSQTASMCKKFSRIWKTDQDTTKTPLKWRWKQRKQTSQDGQCSWFHRWKQHCTWIRATQKIWKYSRILNLRILKACSILLERRLGKIQKLWMRLPWKLQARHGKELHCSMRKEWTGRKHENTFTRIPCCAWEDWAVLMMQTEIGKNKCQLSRCTVLSENYKDWTEGQLISSGQFSQDPVRCSFSTQFRKTWKENTSFQKISVVELSSCPCSMTLTWTRKEMKIRASWLQEQSEITLQDSRMDIGHSKDLDKKTSSTMIMQPVSKPNGTFCVSWMVNDFEKSGHPVFKGISPLGRGILKRKNNRDTIHFI